MSLRFKNTPNALVAILGLLLLFSFAPMAQAACPSAPAYGANVFFMECTEVVNAAAVTSVNLPVPASRLVGDVLIAVITTDGSKTITGPGAPWSLVANVQGTGGANTMAVFQRIATGAETATYGFSWTGGVQAYSFMMNFRNSTGVTTFGTAFSNTGTPTAPSIAVVANALILRIGGWDDDDQTDDPATIITGHTNVTQFASNTGAGTVTGAAAFQYQGNAPGNTGTAGFVNGSEEWAAMTMTIAPNPGPSFLCAGVDGSVVGSQKVIVERCTEAYVTPDAANINLTIPTGTLENDVLLAVVNVDDDEAITIDPSWSVVNYGVTGTSGPTLGIYSKRASAADQSVAGAGTYTFSTPAEEKYGYMLRLTGANGIIQSGASTGTSDTPLAPTINTLAANSLVMRLLAADDPDIVANPLWIMTGQRNITQDRSSATANAVSGAAAYSSQASIAATGSTNFYLTAAEEWRAATIAVEPIEFRISHSGSSSTCGSEIVTLRVTDRNNNPLTWFRGTVTLRTALVPGPGAGTGNWYNPGALAGTLNNGTLNDGIATYTFAAGDNGVAQFEFHTTTPSTLNFNIDFGSLTTVENASGDTNLVVDNLCAYRISFADGQMGTCGTGEPVTISIVDSANLPATRFTGMISINNAPANRGDYSLTSGTLANFSNGTANDGAATYTFVQGESSVQLLYSDVLTGTINFDVTGSGYLVQGGFDPNITVTDCELRIDIVDPGNESDVCSAAQVIFTVTDSSGNTQTGFTGTITISNSSVTGNWSGGGVNLVNNGTANDGIATYIYAAGDLGAVTLNFTNATVNPVINFNASGTATNGTSVINSLAPGFDPNLNVLACTIDIQRTDGISETCSAGEVVTYTIRNRAGAVATTYAGTIVLSNDKTRGDYVANAANGVFSNGTLDDGIATYQYNPADLGVLSVNFSHKIAETVTLAASAAGFTINVGSNRAVTFNSCQFRILYSDTSPGTSDVCSRETVRISVFSSTGVAVSSYTGTINLSTSTGHGSWTISSGNGSVIDPVAGDGSATYNFVPADNGTVFLYFTDAFNESVNINISDGTTSDSNPAFDPNLTVSTCTFRITMPDGSMTACGSQNITITVYNSLSVVATNYTGTVNISTSTTHGSWALQAGSGVLTDLTPGDGIATYAFNAADLGVATLTFTNSNVETVSVNLVDGTITETGAFDPNLAVTGCIPGLITSSCFPGSGGGTGGISVSASNPGRMVVMVIFQRDNENVTSASFGGAAMTQIHEITGINTGVEMWGILNANIPVGAGPHAGAYNFAVAPSTTPAMCLLELSNVEQVFPTVNLGTPTAGRVNANAIVPNGAPNEMSTSITTTKNNAFILSAGVSDYTQVGDSWFNSVTPNPPMTQLFFNNNNQNPVSATAGGSSGIKPVAGLITVTDVDTQDAPTSAAHLVASFNPIVEGAPEATGYEPVLLFDTLTGNLGYKAIGSSMRTASNGGGGTCSFTPSAASASRSADLVLPPGSTVVKAYVYWAGSGEAFEADNTVNFGVTGFESSITADDVFYIDNVGGSGTLDYFAAYKNVTSQVTGSANYTLSNLTIQNDAPWNSTQACAGGWSLVVFYSNAAERFRVANLFHGFQPFQNSAFTLVPRNFRMATTDNPLNVPGAGFLPNGEITHITIEGDETLFTGGEFLGIQTAPGLASFTTLSNSFNPPTADFNSTVTRPMWSNTFGTGYYEFDKTAGINSDGYEIDQAGPDALLAGRTGVEIGASWGFDIDTHYLAGNDSTGVLWNFAQPGNEAEAITTEYSSGQDLVMLISEVIAITNFDLADLEVFKSQVAPFKVNSTGQYQFTVTNNGNGGVTGGEATGQVMVADILPTGLTLASVSGTDWNCSLVTGNAFTCIYDIAADCGIGDGCSIPGELSTGETLPVITANISIGGTGSFPLISNNVKNSVRMQHNGGLCGVLTAGVIPLESYCEQAPQFDNVNNLQGGAININDLDDKSPTNNNVDSVITPVQGIQTDLGITKAVNGILEVGSTGSYTLTVTNYGPDPTTGGAGGTITVTDLQPAGVTFDGASGAGWSCSIGPLNCTYAGVLGVGSSAAITLNVTVTGSAGQNVTNTAQAASGTFNFDANSGNNSDTEITTIVAPPVASQERFLLSVSVPGNSTQIGGLAAFENHDYIVYNPQTDVGAMFYDNSANGYNVNDADAVHLYPNGQIAISADLASSVGSNALAFQPEDIVVWDPILGTASMLFDGSAIFDGPITGNQNIDAVYVKANGRIVFSTAGPASISWPGPNTLSFNQGDIVEYNPLNGSATMLIDASAANIFGGEVQVNGIYIRVDATDADATDPVYVLTVSDANTTIGVCAGCDPAAGTAFTRDDIVEIDLTDSVNPVTQNLFLGDVPLGVFTPADSNREIDAIHVVESGYMGHFSISQSQAGSTCQAGQITIRKHKGLTHSTDVNYSGSIRITTDINQGDWSIAVGSGTLNNGTADDGAATYTFAPGDNGQVTLFLAETTISTINVNVTNGITPEANSEDPNFNYNSVITSVTYKDEWSAVSFANNDGTTFWNGNWIENDAQGVGPATGNILVNAGKLEMASTVANPTPDLSRKVDLSLFNVTQNVYLNFKYAYQFLNSGSDVLIVEARPNGGAWTTVRTFSGIGGSNLTLQSEILNLTTLLGSPVWTANAEIRFRITGGYTGTSRMFFDDIEVATGTTDCGIGSIQHYEIRIDGTTGAPAVQVPGISCVGSVVTITGHDLNNFPSASDETITISTSTGKGDWTLLSGLGVFNNGALGDGIATFDFAPGEQAATFMFNYTNPVTNPEVVNINLSTSYGVGAAEDPSLSVSQAGLLFYNETANQPTNLSPIPTQIAGKNSNVNPDLRLITIEAVRSSDNNPLACAPLFNAGNTLSIGFAAECLDPGVCSPSLTNQFAINGTNMTPAPDNGTVGTTASYAPVNILMVDQGAGRVGGELVFNYADAGQVEMHAQFNIPLNNNPLGTLSGNLLRGSSLPFIVRPFGFDIDFSDDRALNGTGPAAVSFAADATDANAFAKAGEAFSTTVSAITWQQVDDVNNDGIPDDGASLYNNSITPNFGNESTAGDYSVLVSLDSVVAPVVSNPASQLTDSVFSSFTNGVQTKTMVFNEVGIINLSAKLVDSGSPLPGNPETFMGTSNVLGNVKNVGRFTPFRYVLTGGSIVPRALANAHAMRIAPSSFTYLGEEFGLSAMLEAQNMSGAVTANYVDGFVKLPALNNASFYSAFIPVAMAPDTDFSSRLSLGSAPPAVTWGVSGDAIANRGKGPLSGNLILGRQSSGVEDGPYTGLNIGLDIADSDTVQLVLDTDIDEVMPIANDTKIIASASFRYGRLLIDNAFGPETEPLNIPLRVQYFNGTEFVDNVADSSTIISYDATSADPAQRSLYYVPGSYQGNLNDLETVVESEAVLAGTDDVVVSLFQGRTGLTSETDTDLDNQNDDRPLVTSAPGETNEGGALIEFNLSDPQLPYSLNFLKYDWRGGVGEADIYDQVPEGANYNDNPRAAVQFGSYRGHDRVINWQEVYIGPSGP